MKSRQKPLKVLPAPLSSATPFLDLEDEEDVLDNVYEEEAGEENDADAYDEYEEYDEYGESYDEEYDGEYDESEYDESER